MISLTEGLKQIEQGCVKDLSPRNINTLSCGKKNKYNEHFLCLECEKQQKLLLEVIELVKSLKVKYIKGGYKDYTDNGYEDALKDLLGDEK